MRQLRNLFLHMVLITVMSMASTGLAQTGSSASTAQDPDAVKDQQDVERISKKIGKASEAAAEKLDEFAENLEELLEATQKSYEQIAPKVEKIRKIIDRKMEAIRKETPPDKKDENVSSDGK